MFLNEHVFEEGRRERFSPDYEQAQAWQRLEARKQTSNDIVFLQHELAELKLMRSGIVYEIAHEQANAEYNWEKLIDERRRGMS